MAVRLESEQVGGGAELLVRELGPVLLHRRGERVDKDQRRERGIVRLAELVTDGRAAEMGHSDRLDFATHHSPRDSCSRAGFGDKPIRRLASRGRDHHSFVPYLRATRGQRAMAAELRQAGHRERQAPDTPRGRGRPGRWCGLSSRAGRHHPLLSTARLWPPGSSGDGALVNVAFESTFIQLVH